MNAKYYGLIEMVLTFGVVAIFTVHQLWTLRDKPPQDPHEREADDEP